MIYESSSSVVLFLSGVITTLCVIWASRVLSPLHLFHSVKSWLIKSDNAGEKATGTATAARRSNNLHLGLIEATRALSEILHGITTHGIHRLDVDSLTAAVGRLRSELDAADTPIQRTEDSGNEDEDYEESMAATISAERISTTATEEEDLDLDESETALTTAYLAARNGDRIHSEEGMGARMEFERQMMSSPMDGVSKFTPRKVSPELARTHSMLTSACAENFRKLKDLLEDNQGWENDQVCACVSEIYHLICERVPTDFENDRYGFSTSMSAICNVMVKMDGLQTLQKCVDLETKPPSSQNAAVLARKATKVIEATVPHIWNI